MYNYTSINFIYLIVRKLMYKKVVSYIVLLVCSFLTYQFSYAAGTCGIANGYQFPAGATTGDVAAYGLCPANTSNEDYAIYSWTTINSLVLSWDTFNWNCYFVDISQSQSSYQSCTASRLPLAWVCGYTVNSGSSSALQATSPSLCQIGVSTWFSAIPMTLSPLYLAQYNWNCQWSLSTNPTACTTYQLAPTAPGICNAWINGQSFSYSQIQNATLCTQWIPSITILSPAPSNNQRTWSCLGLWWWSDASCTANSIVNGVCSSYTTSVSSLPTSLCASWTPLNTQVSSGSYTWTCGGINWWTTSSLCSVPCTNSTCASIGTGTTTTGSTTTGTNTTGTTTTGTGTPTPISFNLVCNNPAGCICYNVTIVNGSMCLANNFTWVSDSIISSIEVWSVCTDVDGCRCNSLNTIINGAICQTDWLTGYLPWAADLSVYQTVSSGTISRKWKIDITIHYMNRWPNIATWAKLEYYLSPLVSRIRTNVPYYFVNVTSSGYIQSSEYQSNVLVFPLWDLGITENWSLTVTLDIDASLTDEELINSTSISSRLKDSKPLDNAQKLMLSFETQTATNLWNYLANPLLTLQQLMRQYNTMNQWLGVDPVFADIQRWDDNYMSVMTVVRNGIFEWYQYTHSRKFEWDKCSSRIETITVLARMMYNAGSTDIYVSRPSGTAYVDTNSLNTQTQNFINWAHERWLIGYLNPKNVRWSLYLEPNKVVTEDELKNMFSAIYQRYGLDATLLDQILTEWSSCLSRYDFADAIATVLRWNPNVLMGYNDEFINTVITKTNTMSIVDRRDAIQKIIDKLAVTTPSLLYQNGYDPESLGDILQAAMDGREYNPIITNASYTVSLAE